MYNTEKETEIFLRSIEYIEYLVATLPRQESSIKFYMMLQKMADTNLKKFDLSQDEITTKINELHEDINKFQKVTKETSDRFDSLYSLF